MSTTIHTAIRVHPDDHNEIKRLATERGIGYGRFLIDTALHRLPEHRTTTDQRLDNLEERLDRIERLAFSNT